MTENKKIHIIKTIGLQVSATLPTKNTINLMPSTETMLKISRDNIAKMLDQKQVKKVGFDLDFWLEEYFKAKICKLANLEKASIEITKEELEAGITKDGDKIVVS